MRSRVSRSIVLTAASLVAAAATAGSAGAAPVHHCDGVALRVLQRSAEPTVLHAATKISVRGMTCKATLRSIGTMLLQVGSSSPSQGTLPSNLWFADDRDFWAKQHWKIAHMSGDPLSKTGARWHITKGRKISLRFTRWM